MVGVRRWIETQFRESDLVGGFFRGKKSTDNLSHDERVILKDIILQVLSDLPVDNAQKAEINDTVIGIIHATAELKKRNPGLDLAVSEAFLLQRLTLEDALSSAGIQEADIAKYSGAIEKIILDKLNVPAVDTVRENKVGLHVSRLVRNETEASINVTDKQIKAAKAAAQLACDHLIFTKDGQQNALTDALDILVEARGKMLGAGAQEKHDADENYNTQRGALLKVLREIAPNTVHTNEVVLVDRIEKQIDTALGRGRG